jgi:CheY-like chemotaxis protein
VNDPNCRDPALQKSPQSESPARVHASQSSVVLIESDPEDVRLLSAAFVQEEYPGSLEVLNDGEESLAYFSGLGKYEDRVRYPLPSAIVCDLHLPGISGFDVLAWIRERPLLVTIPVYVLTHSQQPQDIQRAFALGARICLTKPMTQERYVALVRAVTSGEDVNPPPPIRPEKPPVAAGKPRMGPAGDGAKRIVVGSSSESAKINPHHKYRVRIGKKWYEGAFSKRWFGWNFDGIEPSGIQLNLIDEVFELPREKLKKSCTWRPRLS